MCAADLAGDRAGADLTRADSQLAAAVPVGEVSADVAGRWLALALATTSADLVGAARGAQVLAVDYAKIR
ncbi:hypothetical protein H7I76_26440 [Mycolicibacterium vaccae]|nr:hypothetical protein [Mycolicibacterium vaccae]